jgi:CheY-like chemotaxis protein
MSAATVERIFEPFFTTKFTGRGMGLAATLGIVSSHHGQIRVNSRVGEGTLMTVWLPLAQDGSRVRTRQATPRRGRAPGGSETILIIDDDPAVSRRVSQILSSLGYVVVAYNVVEAAIAFLETNAEDVDLVLLDLNVPKISSEQLFQQVRSRCKGAPIILASGLDEPQIEHSARSWNAAGFLQKPFSLGALASAVRRALDVRQTTASR